MATTIELLRARLRLELSDVGETFVAQVVYDGTSRVIDTPVGVLDSETVAVTVVGSPDVIWIQGVDYEVDETEAEIIIIRPTLPGVNTVIRIQGTGYKFFSDAESDTFVTEAFRMHLVGRNPMPTYTTLPPTEEYLITILAAVEALWVMATDSSFDIDISIPEGVTIPRSQRFAQIRSEERRVGKECRSRWSPDHEKKRNAVQMGNGPVPQRDPVCDRQSGSLLAVVVHGITSGHS